MAEKAIASPLNNGSEQPMVRIRGLNHYFGKGENRKQGLVENHLTLMPGELVIMTGPSGSGKTTILTLIGALRTVQEGSVQVMGQELSGLNSQQLTEVRRGIGFIFQAHNLFDSLTAFQNVKMALELRTYTQAEMTQLATDMLTRLGLAQRIHYKPRQLSGGQRQRVAVARALVNRPKLVLADEPTAALDKVSGREVVTMFKEMAKNERCTILMVTHDNRILDVADRIVNMVDGRIASEILVEEAVTICEFLIKCPVFEKSTPAQLTEISQKMLKEHYTPGTTIIRQGDEGDKFFLIRDGTVDVLVKEGDGVPRKVATMGPGDFFGETALLTGEPRNATVVAKDDVVLYELKKDDFLAALNASATFNQQLRDIFFQRSQR
ncbi:MAG: ATP-binding cassette domain-containing protein [Gemmataceae bacterium]|nr:ATP-binding cassette domain-containing protein [Gemmataceae bacterium]